MEFLKNLNIEENTISWLEKNIPSNLIKELVNNSSLVTSNINYIKEYGITNYSEVLKKYPDIFLMDNDKFSNIFAKYDKDDTIAKVEKNITIIEYL